MTPLDWRISGIKQRYNIFYLQPRKNNKIIQERTSRASEKLFPCTKLQENLQIIKKVDG